MTDEKKRPRIVESVDIRRSTARSPESARADPASRREVDELRGEVVLLREKMSDWRRDLIAGVERHIETSIGSMREDITKALSLLKDAERWRATIERVEVNEKAKEIASKEIADRDAAISRALGHHQQAVDVATRQADAGAKQSTAIDSRIDGPRKRRIAWATAVAAPVVTLLVGLIAMLASRCH